MIRLRKIENKTTAMKLIELTRGEELEKLLHNMYVKEQLSIREIASNLNVHYHTVNSWLKQIGIQMRLPQEKMLEIVEIRRKLKCSNNK